MLALLDESFVPAPTFRNDDLIAWLLIGLLSLVLVLGAVSIFLVLQLRRSIRFQKPKPVSRAIRSQAASPLKFNPQPREPLDRWLAIKFQSPQAVQAALDLRRPAPCSWEQGLADAREDLLFISPPIQGWIIVFGPGLPDPTDDVDFIFRFVMDLSQTFGQVQYFSASRVLKSHAWVMVDRATVMRGYAWAGTTLWNQGAMSAAERELGLQCFDYGEQPTTSIPSERLHRANVEKISQLARRWSVDPRSLDKRAIPANPGIAGTFMFNKLH